MILHRKESNPSGLDSFSYFKNDVYSGTSSQKIVDEFR
jgi:hypothetical protein